jgi:hypothetical protein
VARALESVRNQTLPVADIVMVEHVLPFYRAINEGAGRVRTPFFVQVDADMILDPDCVRTLRDAMRDDVGILVAELRDALCGQVVGIKLFRTECFENGGMPDSVSQDTDFGARLAARGWRTAYIEHGGGGQEGRPTVGEHRPDYTAAYTYRKFLLEGAKLRHRGARHGLFWRMGTLEEHPHAMSGLAQLALGHGLFVPLERDESAPAASEPDGERLERLLESEGRGAGDLMRLLPLSQHARLRDVFRGFRAGGEAVSQANAGATCRALLSGLRGSRRDARALVAKVALGHGLIERGGADRVAADEDTFRRFMVFSLGSQSSAWDQLAARARHVLDVRRRPRSYAPW